MKNRIVSLLASTISLGLVSACSDSELEAQLLAGEELARQNCKVCHAQGINGAPIIGNLKMWGPRIEKGREALVMNAFNGNGLMPPKGGNEEITKEEINLVVGYFLAELEQQ